ncbi:macrophage mannose receptor 1-like [Cololabis saira]|uniref:macrophage mannose receptor 1-like n=1 Tax=Cololabis saira TaxID=129043 RepID=UPI002AD356E3|nr:macrophage mannose receptor 1-like [Cololabis saira]
MMETLICLSAVLALCPVSSLDARHYHYVYEEKNWTEAQSYCREKYTDLVTMETMEDVKMLNDLADTSKLKADQLVWIGLYDDMNSWRWSMSDRKETEFTNWQSGEPNNLDGYEYCVETDPYAVWNDKPCFAANKPVCADVTGQTVTFVFINITMNWTDAQHYCREHHTDLASVRNMIENQKIKGVIPAGEYVWIGLFRDSWKWSDGSKLSFMNWNKDEPDNSGENDTCAAAGVKNSGKWEDGNCVIKRPFICYRAVPKQVVRLKLIKPSSLDLKDPIVLEHMLDQLKQKLKEQGVNGDVKLSWRKQSDGNIFYKEKTEEEKTTPNKNEL